MVSSTGNSWPSWSIFAVLLLLTGFPPFLGWIVGLGLLLWSPLWTARQKLLGALVWPGGFMTYGMVGLLMASPSGETVCSSAGTPLPVDGTVSPTVTTIGSLAETCTTSGGGSFLPIVLLVVLVAAPVVVAAYLYRAAGRASVNA